MKKPMSVEEMTSMLEGKKKISEDEKCDVCGATPCECEEDESDDEMEKEDEVKKPSLFNDDSKKIVSIVIGIGKPKK